MPNQSLICFLFLCPPSLPPSPTPLRPHPRACVWSSHDMVWFLAWGIVRVVSARRQEPTPGCEGGFRRHPRRLQHSVLAFKESQIRRTAAKIQACKENYFPTSAEMDQGFHRESSVSCRARPSPSKARRVCSAISNQHQKLEE